jgi:hypothetical protein
MKTGFAKLAQVATVKAPRKQMAGYKGQIMAQKPTEAKKPIIK